VEAASVDRNESSFVMEQRYREPVEVNLDGLSWRQFGYITHGDPIDGAVTGNTLTVGHHTHDERSARRYQARYSNERDHASVAATGRYTSRWFS